MDTRNMTILGVIVLVLFAIAAYFIIRANDSGNAASSTSIGGYSVSTTTDSGGISSPSSSLNINGSLNGSLDTGTTSGAYKY